MKKIIILALSFFMLTACNNSSKNPTMNTVESKFPFEQTLETLKNEIKAKDMGIMQVIRHDELAQKNGLEINPTAVIIFGNPKVGTALMQESPAIAYELPLRFLVYEKDGKTFVLYKSPKEYESLGIKENKPVLDKMQNALQSIAEKVQ
ncbi:DUF302 domain-containing protein [Ornithobacterium rhinotracheale]|uniref:DUF302 domain-containing protein n=1 Tax=Ornithobacterium rhinotracheale (strain ATCC 51463 / DSM 15997 / CCUG 23171 / CIP 104009 / LMG 9086) TaxID=867902 RepID=I4A2V9_ORNRL|nr:DUF302 domain-containing protein [Ornithobacterium rhinotracheale]AFL98293.1 hypothetical protein Ornrh_2161 [Ornithobacterium rhinotracheale DSM 15997]AIQ00067.1 hypothetical protein Q785_10925 [Ornithobacterium rhinotracheale ORT-UMN 88]KGB66404.1 hypothetical protein Q787_10520 [Ornithobacterium rhinotracheale H06-030791]MCK0193361.1 DUF302 domain-containing protein [Ornithobacterium rhinotracheale]MCK0201214.1 DUF302 domain-containing protein [Ornithobacterium rhinotracheale]